MLGTIREKTQGIFAFIVVGLLIIPFALWGINSYFEGNPNPPVAEVDGIEISKESFEQVYRNQVNRYRGRIDPKLLSSGFLKQQVLTGMIREVILTEHARDAGYTISNAQLNKLIQNQPEFRNQDKFDADRFAAILRANGIDEDTYKREMRYVKTQDQILSGFKSSAIVTQAEIDQVIALQQQQRRISYLLLKPEYLRSQVKVSGPEIESYYKSNKLKFQTADQVRVDYVVLSMDELIARQKLTEKEVHDEYERNLPHYRTPAMRRASHILVELASDATAAEEKAARERISAIRKKIRAGADFAAVAKKESDDPLTGKKGGDLGMIRPGTLPSRDLEAALVKLSAGQVSEPVRSQYGLHLLKLTSFTPAKTKPFAEVRKELERSLRVRRGEAAFDDLRERFETLVYEHNDSLKPAAADTGLKVQTSDWIGRNGGKGILASPEVVRAAFSLQVRQLKQNSELIEADRNVLVALRIREDRPATDKPLSAVRAQIQATLMQQKTQRAARDLGEQLLQQARGGKSLSALAAKRAGVKYFSPVWVKRADLDSPGKAKIDQAITRAAFAAGRPEAGKPVYGGMEVSGQGYALYQLHEVKAGDVRAATPKQRADVRALIEQRRGSGYYSDQLNSLRQQAEVETHADQLQAQNR